MNVAHRKNSLSVYEGKQLQLIRRTVAKDCTDAEFDVFMQTCRHVGLDPFRRQIHCVIYNADIPDKRQMTLITSIDGMRAIAGRSGRYRPNENPPTFEYDENLKSREANPVGLVSASVTVWKMAPDGTWHPLTGIAHWEEFAPLDEEFNWVDTGEVWPDTGKPKKKKVGTGVFKITNKFWLTKPRLMLAKCAEAQALRRGWPEDLSGIYEESDASLTQHDLAPSEEVETVEAENRQALIGRGNIFVFFNEEAGLEPVPAGQFADRVCAFLSTATSAEEVLNWQQFNKAGLNEFWARCGNDALELKRAIEARVEELSIGQEAAE